MSIIPNIGLPGLILILVIALVIFGPSKLPEIGRAFGKSLKEFKKGARELTEDEEPKKETHQAIAEDKDKDKSNGKATENTTKS